MRRKSLAKLVHTSKVLESELEAAPALAPPAGPMLVQNGPQGAWVGLMANAIITTPGGQLHSETPVAARYLYQSTLLTQGGSFLKDLRNTNPNNQQAVSYANAAMDCWWTFITPGNPVIWPNQSIDFVLDNKAAAVTHCAKPHSALSGAVSRSVEVTQGTAQKTAWNSLVDVWADLEDFVGVTVQPDTAVRVYASFGTAGNKSWVDCYYQRNQNRWVISTSIMIDVELALTNTEYQNGTALEIHKGLRSYAANQETLLCDAQVGLVREPAPMQNPPWINGAQSSYMISPACPGNVTGNEPLRNERWSGSVFHTILHSVG